MTLGEGKRKVRMLLDEYSSGGAVLEEPDLEARMADLFDLAQRSVAAVCPPIRSFTPVPSQTAGPGGGLVACPVPEDFWRPFRVWENGRITGRYRWTEGALLLPAEGAGELWAEYFARPAPIPPDAPDSYCFELAPEGAACMPYYVAAQLLAADLVVDYQPLLLLYQGMLSALRPPVPGSGGGVRQALYQGRRGVLPCPDGGA